MEKYVWSNLDMGNFFFSVKGQIANRLEFVGPSDPRAAVTKYHKFGGLNQQKCILSVLEARSPEARCGQGHAASEVLGKHLFPASLPSSDGCWQHLTPLARSCIPPSLPSSSHGPFSCLCVRLCLQIPLFCLMKRTVIGFEAHPNLV